MDCDEVVEITQEFDKSLFFRIFNENDGKVSIDVANGGKITLIEFRYYYDDLDSTMWVTNGVLNYCFYIKDEDISCSSFDQESRFIRRFKDDETLKILSSFFPVSLFDVKEPDF